MLHSLYNIFGTFLTNVISFNISMNLEVLSNNSSLINIHLWKRRAFASSPFPYLTSLN